MVLTALSFKSAGIIYAQKRGEAMKIYECERCGRIWKSNMDHRPKKCPKCGVASFDNTGAVSFRGGNVPYPVIPGYFAVTKVFHEKTDLDGWAKWLQHKNIKTKYVRVAGEYWALYREGVEVVGHKYDG